MDNIKKNLGFGFMRLPMQGESVDIAETTRMVDAFLDAGSNYFDTAHGYLQGKSELALRECFTSRYPHDRYILTNKLAANFFKTEADIRPFFPLDAHELAAVERVQQILHSKHLIPCTACRYCTDGCPQHISIPDLFATMNTKQLYHTWNADFYYHQVHTAPGRKASNCLGCGKCEQVCPQHLPIRSLLADVAKEFETA